MRPGPWVPGLRRGPRPGMWGWGHSPVPGSRWVGDPLCEVRVPRERACPGVRAVVSCRCPLCGRPLSWSGTGCGDSEACPRVGVASDWAEGPAPRAAGGPEEGAWVEAWAWGCWGASEGCGQQAACSDLRLESRDGLEGGRAAAGLAWRSASRGPGGSWQTVAGLVASCPGPWRQAGHSPASHR